jgi:hypothetical protein
MEMTMHMPAPSKPGLTRLARAKWAFTTRHVDRRDIDGLLPATTAHTTAHTVARPGQLVLARVTHLGRHEGLQLASGRCAELYVGDLVVVCLGDPCAPEPLDSVAGLEPDAGCELLAAGGVAGVVRHGQGRSELATRLQLLAHLADGDGRPINIRRYALPLPPLPPLRRPDVPVLLVVGSSMNTGKTTACASLVHGLARAGWRVGAAKVTGTGSLADVQSYADAGAAEVLDFTDAGHASTRHLDEATVETVARALVAELERRGCDVVVVEVGDGLCQRETAALLASAALRRCVRGLVFAAADTAGAVAGVQQLRQQGWPVLAFTGLLTTSPRAAAEAEAALMASHDGTPSLGRDDLRKPDTATRLAGLAPSPLLRQAA